MRPALLLFVALLRGLPLGAQTGSTPDSVDRNLARLDSLYAGLPGWAGRLYDPRSGGFYANRGMRERATQYGPDIQSSAMVLTILTDGGLNPESVPGPQRQRFVRFFQQRQDPRTGFFSDPDYPQTRASTRVLGRLLGFSQTALSRFGAKPLYPLPGRQPNPEGLAHYRSAEALRQWLEALPWSKSVWSALDALAAQKEILKTLPPASRDGFVRQMYDYALARQDNDGLWGRGQPVLVRLSGTVKFSWFCRDFGLPLPHPDRIYRQVMAWYESEPSTRADFQQDACFPGNAIRLLGELRVYLPQPFPEEDLRQVVGETYRMVRAFAAPDGGFARVVGRAFIRPDDLPSLGEFTEPMGDVNGTAQLVLARHWCYQLTGRPQPPLPRLGDFLNAIERSQPPTR